MGALILAGLVGVLPLQPIVLSAVAAELRLAPLALVAGLVAGYAVLGVMLSLLTTAIGLELDMPRIGAAAM